MDLEEQKPEEETPSELVQRLKLPFTDLFLVARALTHRSYTNEHSDAIEDNERLEFLGDAILDFTVAAWLYHHYPEMPEGDLTRMRSALVHTDQLAQFARQLDLGPAMRLGHGEVQAGGRNRSVLLCNTFEALIGALYLQVGIEYTQKYIGVLCEENADIILDHHKNEDPKSKLQEWSQGNGLLTPLYVTKNSVGPDHAKQFEVEVFINNNSYGIGFGPSKQTAEKGAAIAALKLLGLYNRIG